MLDDLERGVDHSGSKLDSAMTRMKHFIRQTEGELQDNNKDIAQG